MKTLKNSIKLVKKINLCLHGRRFSPHPHFQNNIFLFGLQYLGIISCYQGSLNKIPSKSSNESSKQQYFQKLNPVTEERVFLCQGVSLGNHDLNEQCIPVKKQTHNSFKMT